MPCRELSFKKGDFLDLVHSIDDNWLEAKLAGNKGNVPRSYVKVRDGVMTHRLSEILYGSIFKVDAH